MSLQANLEFAIHIESFTNIHLYDMGVYFLQFSIYHQNTYGKLIIAHPFSFIQGKIVQNIENTKTDSKPWVAAQINEESDSFHSQGFLMRFQKQQIEINDICFFKTQIDLDSQIYQDAVFCIVCELMCCDISTFGYSQTQTQDQSLFIKKASFQAKLQNSHLGLHEYMHITFDDQYFCFIQTTVHTLLQDFQFRMVNVNKLTVNYDENMILKQEEKQKVIQNVDNSGNSYETRTVILGPQNMCEYLHLKYGTDRVNVNKFYLYFIQGFRETYHSHRKFLELCLDVIQKENIKIDKSQPFFNQLPDLPLPTYTKEYLKQNPQSKDSEQEKFPLQDSSKTKFTICEVYNIQEPKQYNFLSESILSDINQTSGVIYMLWKYIFEILEIAPQIITHILKIQYDNQVQDRWGEFINETAIPCSYFYLTEISNIGKEHDLICTQIRKQKQDQISFLNIHDFAHLPQPDIHPFMFQEIYVQKGYNKFIQRNREGKHVIVLCHGYQGSSYDMYMLKHHIGLHFPGNLYLCSKANQDDTECSIDDMGEKLAQEIREFINKNCEKDFGRLSFFGHSLGGLIIRAALPKLKDFSDMMYSFITTGSPHLGSSFGSNALFNMGFQVFKMFKKSACLEMLSLNDAVQKEDCYLFKLSKQQGLQWFQNIVLVGSYQDQYSSFDSARIQISISSPPDMMYRKMAENILGNLPHDQITRIDMHFVLQEKSIDNMIGRAAHILFLENEVWINMLIQTQEFYFA